MEVNICRTVHGKADINITGATLLSIEEAQNLPKHLRKYNGCWWLRSLGFFQTYATDVLNDGSVCVSGNYVHTDTNCVRPAITFENVKSSDIQIGDRFHYNGVEFEVISDNLAFCTSDIGYCAFRKDWAAKDANDYEKSDVKKFVDNWFNDTSDFYAEDDKNKNA